MSYAVAVQKSSISHALVLSSPTPKRACGMRATGQLAAVALDHGNSLRRGQPIARPHRGVLQTYRSTAIYASCRNAETQKVSVRNTRRDRGEKRGVGQGSKQQAAQKRRGPYRE